MARDRKSTPADDKKQALYGRLRELGMRAQSLQEIAAKLEARALELVDPAARERELLALLAEDWGTVELNLRSGHQILQEVRGLLTGWDKLYASWGDTVARLEIAWERSSVEWQKIGNAEAKDWARPLARVVAALDGVIYDCGMISIPARLPLHLKLLPIGGRLDFAAAYADELPTADGRRRFLQYMSRYPESVEGLIDVDAGCIYRADPRPRRRALSLVNTVVLALVGFLLLFGASLLGEAYPLSGWPFNAELFPGHAQAYLFLLLGALAHVVINLLKQDRSASRSTEAVSEWILRIHVKEKSYYLSAISLWVGGLALPFLFEAGEIDWKMAFFVGYSYDSFIDLFLQRFDKTVAAATGTLTTRLAAAGASEPDAAKNATKEG